MCPPTFTHERELIAAGYLPIGVDEAGCGCLAGPVVAAAVHLPLDSRIGLIRDSKLLSAAQRGRLLVELRDRGAVWAIGNASVEEIDHVNIRQATYLAMERAVRTFLNMTNDEARVTNQARMTNTRTSTPSDLVIDSSFVMRNSSLRECNAFALVDAWTIPDLPIPQRAIVHGDRLVKSVAAASIVAKVTRDAMMDEIHTRYPQYHFAQHRGYATAAHRSAIDRYGPCAVHRMTFLSTLTASSRAMHS